MQLILSARKLHLLIRSQPPLRSLNRSPTPASLPLRGNHLLETSPGGAGQILRPSRAPFPICNFVVIVTVSPATTKIILRPVSLCVSSCVVECQRRKKGPLDKWRLRAAIISYLASAPSLRFPLKTINRRVMTKEKEEERTAAGRDSRVQYPLQLASSPSRSLSCSLPEQRLFTRRITRDVLRV